MSGRDSKIALIELLNLMGERPVTFLGGSADVMVEIVLPEGVARTRLPRW